MADDSPFAVAGMWRTWEREDGGVDSSFTLITINADDHALMNRFHKPAAEKRSQVLLNDAEWKSGRSWNVPVDQSQIVAQAVFKNHEITLSRNEYIALIGKFEPWINREVCSSLKMGKAMKNCDWQVTEFQI